MGETNVDFYIGGRYRHAHSADRSEASGSFAPPTCYNNQPPGNAGNSSRQHSFSRPVHRGNANLVRHRLGERDY
jgi:hypothetical protein